MHFGYKGRLETLRWGKGRGEKEAGWICSRRGGAFGVDCIVWTVNNMLGRKGLDHGQWVVME